MGISTQSESDVVSDINVTPLVDVVLVLLVVFMVTAKLIAGQTLPMDLPKAASGSEQQLVLAVELAADGRIAVNGKPSSVDEVSALAEATLARNPDLRVVIDADGRVPHKDVVRVMDRVKGAGVSRIAFGVEDDKRGAP